jgi:hypothetical protein
MHCYMGQLLPPDVHPDDIKRLLATLVPGDPLGRLGGGKPMIEPDGP